MALTRTRKTINLGNGWKQVVYLNPFEFAAFQLFIVLPIQLTILFVKGMYWVGIKLPFMAIKYVFNKVKHIIQQQKLKKQKS